jgi:hypothetical protein
MASSNWPASAYLNPKDQLEQVNLAVALLKAGKPADAVQIAQRLLEADPNNAKALLIVGLTHALAKRYEQAVEMFRKSVKADPLHSQAHYNLGVGLLNTEGPEQAEGPFRQALKLDPKDVATHYTLGVLLADLAKHEEAIPQFEWVIAELEPKVKQPIVNREDGMYVKYASARIRHAWSLLAVGRIADALAAAQRNRAELHLTETPAGEERQPYLVICKQLLPLESKLPAIVAGKEIPEDAATVRALAQWHYFYRGQPLAAVRLYEVLFTRQPPAADDLASRLRFEAAGAAALAASGSGAEAAKLDAGAKAGLRKKALEWLRADLDAWAKRPMNAGSRLREWQQCKELKSVREPAALAKLPDAEREEWQRLWADVAALIAGGPLEQGRGARTHL